MASNGSTVTAGDAENSLEKIKQQLASGSGKYLLQGPLMKRSETLRKWNERWVILDPTTGKMEYKLRRNETAIKGTILFDSNSIITVSPVNVQGLPKYDGCCFYFSTSTEMIDIGTPQKKEYFLCAETPGAAKAWVSTLHATQLVLRVHKEAVNNLSGSSSAKAGTVATVVAAANSTAMEASKEIEAAMRISIRSVLGLLSSKANEGQLDDLTIVKETMRVKDEELHQLTKDLRTRDSTIKEITDKLVETAEAAEAATSAAHAMDDERRLAYAKLESLRKDVNKQLQTFHLKLEQSEEKLRAVIAEREHLLKQRNSAVEDAHLLRFELAKARERAVVLEAAVMRAEERARVSEVVSEARVRGAVEKVLAAVKEKEDLQALVNYFQSQVQRQQHTDTKPICNERSEAHTDANNSPLLTKHVNLSEDNVDKACLNDPRLLPVSVENEIQLGIDGIEIHSIGDAAWSDFRSSAARVADVREVTPESEGNSLDISVVSTPSEDLQHGGGSR